MEQDDAVLRMPGRERFRRTRRLRSPRDFQRVRRLGRHVSSPLLTLSYARQAFPPARTRRPSEVYSVGAGFPPEPSLLGEKAGLLPVAPAGQAETAEAPTRIGFSVSKRVGNAVMRNRVKRRLREAVRRTLGDLPPGWDIVLVARPAAAAADYATLNTTVRELLARARLTHQDSSRGQT